MKNLNK